MRCIVTGGVGFIGSHLVNRLLFDGHDVTVLDNLSSGRLDHLSHQRDHAGLRIVQADVVDIESIQPSFQGVDWVFPLLGCGNC